VEASVKAEWMRNTSAASGAVHHIEAEPQESAEDMDGADCNALKGTNQNRGRGRGGQGRGGRGNNRGNNRGNSHGQASGQSKGNQNQNQGYWQGEQQTPPANYKCYSCGNKGHFRRDCPTPMNSTSSSYRGRGQNHNIKPQTFTLNSQDFRAFQLFNQLRKARSNGLQPQTHNLQAETETTEEASNEISNDEMYDFVLTYEGE
jgi:hypothetical protein